MLFVVQSLFVLFQMKMTPKRSVKNKDIDWISIIIFCGVIEDTRKKGAISTLDTTPLKVILSKYYIEQ